MTRIGKLRQPYPRSRFDHQMNNFLPDHDAFKSEEEEGAALRPGQPAARGVFSRLVLRTLNVEVAVRPSTHAHLVAGGCLVACNHVSFLDGILLALASPVPLSITCEPLYARRTWWSRALFGVLSRLGFGTVLTLGPESPQGIRSVLRALASRSSVVVFPEGRISPDGLPLPAMPGFNWLKRRTWRLVHMRIEGAHRSRMFGKKGDQWCQATSGTDPPCCLRQECYRTVPRRQRLAPDESGL